MKHFSLLAVLLVALLCGCGSKGPVDYPVSGKVTWEGQPISYGYITLMPTDASGMAPDSGTITDGKFDFRAKPGPKRVEVRADREVGPVDKSMGGAAREQYIPAHYNDKSTLKAEVPEGGKNDYEFALTKDAKPAK